MERSGGNPQVPLSVGMWGVREREESFGSFAYPASSAYSLDVEGAMGLYSSPPVHFLEVISSYLRLYALPICRGHIDTQMPSG